MIKTFLNLLSAIILIYIDVKLICLIYHNWNNDIVKIIGFILLNIFISKLSKISDKK